MSDATDPAPRFMRTVRSFVKRGGRVTESQQRALEQLWPTYGVPYSAAPIDLDALFGRSAPRVVEIGFGDGATLVALATANPGTDFLGIEVHPPGVGRCLHDAAAAGLANVRVSNHDAVEVLTHQLADASLDEVLVYFPDPWHKKRHNKRRLVQPAFAALVARKLKPGGRWRLATDWQPYAEQMLEVLNAVPAFRNASADGTFVPRPERRPVTKFERRGQRLGHGVWDLEFVRA